jgi:predicted acylesterase/phospholipase RssA
MPSFAGRQTGVPARSPDMTEKPSPAFGGHGPLALCLSGGGFRATFFHLGVIRLLAELDCLKRVTHVFSVSGGSIMAAHLGLNWAAYKDRNVTAFQDLSDALVEFARNDLRGRIVRRWLLTRDRAASLQREYNSIFKNARLSELPSTPSFHFLSTSMTTGRLCAFTRESFLVVREDGNVDAHPAESQPVAQAVAASSAFPPLFPPLRLELPDLPKAQFPIAEYLTDGGVFDNLGISCVDRFVTDAVRAGFARIIVSDASALFDHAPETPFGSLVSRATRTTDILMQRVASLEADNWSKPEERLAMIRITDVVADLPMATGWFRSQSQKAQRLLKSVRTDFDTFPVPLIRSLVEHGYEAAFQSALTSAASLSLEEYRKRAATVPDEVRKDEVFPWDPMPPGWPDRKKMQDYGQRAAMRKPLEQLQAAIEQWQHAVGNPSSAKAAESREEIVAMKRGAIEQLENLLKSASTRPIGLWFWRDWTAWLLAALVAGALALMAIVIVRAMMGMGVVPAGTLAITEIAPYTGEGWVTDVPVLTPLLGRGGRFYTLATAPLGELTNNRAHAAAIANLRLTPELANAHLYLFLEDTTSAQPRLIVLEQARLRQLSVPSGGPRDRLRGILVDDTNIGDLPRRINEVLSIVMEKRP